MPPESEPAQRASLAALQDAPLVPAQAELVGSRKLTVLLAEVSGWFVGIDIASEDTVGLQVTGSFASSELMMGTGTGLWLAVGTGLPMGIADRQLEDSKLA